MRSALVALAISSAALAQDAGVARRVRITVRAIEASAEGGMDARLRPIAEHIQSFADQSKYRGYKVLDEQHFDLDWKSPAQMELPGSRALLITPRQLAPDGKIKVHLEVLGAHPAHSRKVHTDYSIQKGGTILIGGLDNGKLLIAVTQEIEKE